MQDLPQIDEIIRSKRKTLALSIDKEARLIVRAPMRLDMKKIEAFIISKKQWIETKQALTKQKGLLHNEKQYAEGEEYMYVGRRLILKLANVDKIKIHDNYILMPKKYSDKLEQKLIQWYKAEATKILSDQLFMRSVNTGIKYNSIKIGRAHV